MNKSKARRLARARADRTGEDYETALRAVRSGAARNGGRPDPNDAHYDPYGPDADEPVDPVWPAGLLLPDSARPLLYLDLNHWIGLSDARLGRPNGGRYQSALEAARDARAANRVVFPLSGSHYMEIAKIVDPRRRAGLTAIMEELSGFTTALSRTQIMRLEMETVADQTFGPADPIGPAPYLGYGVNHALGVLPEMALGNSATDLEDEVRRVQSLEFISKLPPEWRQAFERISLTGPQDDTTEADLRRRGWQPNAAAFVAHNRARSEQNQVDILDASPDWRSGRLRDVVSCRELCLEAWDAYTEAATCRRADTAGAFDSHEKIRRFTRSMPSMEVAIAIKTHYHRNPTAKWTQNATFDIDAMAVAVPYCQAVATDGQVVDALRGARMPEIMSTTVMSGSEDLVEWLSAA
jgi:hypothetical protein